MRTSLRSTARLPRLSLLACVPMLLVACAATAPTPPTPAAAPPQFKESGIWKRASATTVSVVSESWWSLFKDPILDDLQRQLLIGNESLRSASSQVAAARATVQASQSALWPTLSVGAGGNRVASPATGSVPVSVASSYSVNASAAWELDLWGRLSQGVSVADAKLQATSDDLAAARLSAQATLVQTYFSMRAAEAQQDVLRRTVTANQRTLDLTQARFAAGVVAQSDVLQAQTQIRTVQVQLKEAELQRAQLEHAIAVLLGKAPSTLAIAQTGRLPKTPMVPTLLPATLLEQRPDIAAAERRVAAAYAQIGVANAAFFPALTLSASAGYRGAVIEQLVSAPNLLWSIGPSLAVALLDGGVRKLAADQALSAADQATSVYRQTVLTAFQEVEDNLVLLDSLHDESTLQLEGLKSSQRNLEITLDQYKAGTVSYLNVTASQTAVLTAEATMLSLQNRQLSAVNQLLKNVGGRWQVVNR
ncbi:MAG: efflux transporter outer membrane subunit [Rhodoferax sp.]|nr:efflux transporter outer membrane subunit [Rhodoferax sp.]